MSTSLLLSEQNVSCFSLEKKKIMCKNAWDESEQLKSELYRQALLHTVLSEIPWVLQK